MSPIRSLLRFTNLPFFVFYSRSSNQISQSVFYQTQTFLYSTCFTKNIPVIYPTFFFPLHSSWKKLGTQLLVDPFSRRHCQRSCQFKVQRFIRESPSFWSTPPPPWAHDSSLRNPLSEFGLVIYIMSISTATQIYSPENICDPFIHVNGSCFCDYCNPSCSLQPTPSHTAPILRQPASNFYLKMQSNPYYSTELHEAINDINEALEVWFDWRRSSLEWILSYADRGLQWRRLLVYEPPRRQRGDLQAEGRRALLYQQSKALFERSCSFLLFLSPRRYFSAVGRLGEL